MQRVNSPFWKAGSSLRFVRAIAKQFEGKYIILYIYYPYPVYIPKIHNSQHKLVSRGLVMLGVADTESCRRYWGLLQTLNAIADGYLG